MSINNKEIMKNINKLLLDLMKILKHKNHLKINMKQKVKLNRNTEWILKIKDIIILKLEDRRRWNIFWLFYLKNNPSWFKYCNKY